MRLSWLMCAAVLATAPVFAGSAEARDRDWRDRDRGRVEVFYRDGCRVEREWRGRGRFEERVDCSRRERDRRWDSRGRDDRWSDDRRYSDRGWNERGWNDRGWDDRGWDDRRYIGAFFSDDHRRIISNYTGRDCRRWSRDGRRPYSVGSVFPSDYGWRPISRDLYAQLPRAPYGYSYVRFDDDVLLIREATRLVIDAILLSGERRDRRW